MKKYTWCQKFADSRFGCSATLRYENNHSEHPYVLRCRDASGYLYFKKHYRTASYAKLELEKVVCPHCCQYSKWWTVSGNVVDFCDIILEDNAYAVGGGVDHNGETLAEFLESISEFEDWHGFSAKEINSYLHECGIKTVFS